MDAVKQARTPQQPPRVSFADQPPPEDRAFNGHLGLRENLLDYVSLPTVEVRMRSANAVTYECALLDWGSQLTIIDASVARFHNLKGPRRPSRIGTIHPSSRPDITQRVSFTIESIEQDVKFDLENIEALDGFDLIRPAISRDQVMEAWPHLKPMQMRPIDETLRKVTLLIGLDTPGALDILETLRAPDDEPDAPKGIRTPLGWCLVGPLTGHATGRQRVYVAPDTAADNQELENVSTASVTSRVSAHCQTLRGQFLPRTRKL